MFLNPFVSIDLGSIKSKTDRGGESLVKIQPESLPHCLRCKTTDLVALDSPDGISFFECPNCHRNFARKAGGAMCFRWLHPISLVLYPVSFEADPVQQCARVADMFAKEKSSEQIKLIVQEIKLELDDPTQQVRDILECSASEEDVRKYLRCVAARLEKIT
jgi:transposase-like protein